jgi:signal transduction histidine kinase
VDGARPRPIDAVAVLVAAGVTVATRYEGPALAVLLCVALSVLWMRRAPLTVAWISAASAVALPMLAPAAMTPQSLVPIWPPTCGFVAYAALAFAAPRHHGTPQWLPVGILALAVLPLAERLPTLASDQVVFRTEAVIALSALSGLYVAVKDRLRRELSERAERVERERLAGEMHDVVTHRVSRMVLQAGALAMNSDDERTRAVAEELRAAGCEALDELRHMVALLRRGTGEGFDLGFPLPDLRPLITESASVGVPVELVVDGTPVPTSGAVGRTAYQVVQEMLANVGEVAYGAQARVHVRYLQGEMRIGVWSTAGDASWPSELRQRVELAGGTLRSGKDEDGGFHVEAAFPTP